ncbi:MAG: exopolysaccharide biosynthesis protein [Tissierellia bacterium]|nr:hypothetical protein [Bacillota bacterium]NLL22306.1 exopolysaccharide biosynthesis protein [Tissierellia bacterium]
MKQPNIHFNLNEFLQTLREKAQQKSTVGRGLPVWTIALITLAGMSVYFFFALPSLSPQGGALYSFLAGGILFFTALRLLLGRQKPGLKQLRTAAIAIISLFVFPILMTLLSSPIFHAKSYANLIQVEQGVFSEDIQRISISQIPIVDRETASIIGEKQMGAIAELVSQFEIDANYAQININGKPIRVSPIKYFDIIKYISNYRDGLQYYISVDMTNQEGDLVKLDNPIMYSSSDYLMRNIHRKIRFQYPFHLLGETNFELDDEGNAYYVTPILTKRIFLFGGLDAKGAIITDAHTGESVSYDTADVPPWVDRVYPSEMIMSQLDMKGLYQGGFFNSIIGQKNVTQTTEGYNYISLDTDIYQVTGVTSVRADTSNLGFYYINLRTKETKFYSVPSATEISAMASAKGAVQEKNYTPTFPVLLNLGGDPVYFMSLKDAAKVAKLYALVDAVDFTKVIVEDTVSEALRVYASSHPSELGAEVGSFVEKRITIKELHEVVIDGNTLYYFLVKEDSNIYSALAKEIGSLLAFAKPGDTFAITGVMSEGEVTVHTLEK